MTSVAIAQLDQNVRTWLQESRDQILAAMASKVNVDTKTNRNDLVTNVDKANQLFLIGKIRQAYPQAHIEGEEGTSAKAADLTGLVFFVDPIDGTMNFVRQRANFAVMIGVYENGQPLYGAIMDVMANAVVTGGPDWPLQLNHKALSAPGDPELAAGLLGVNGPMALKNKLHLGDIALASSGARMSGSAGMEFNAIARGQLVGYVSYLQPWDIAAGLAIGRSFGLIVTRPDGEPIKLLEPGIVVAAMPRAQEQILLMMNELD
ncbi:inositol monophosphatase family protein [Lacticaseibacillus nasuensis]|uniref:Myo-inositol-1(Or 4)-monophosphatase n=1 Tax=Lacticaseibacillus nasuensis JCM 17158 TaxID=1291734 RepID=A0A0R1K076_9LACO|nr:inositol monophosphatase family protein [Lacticaseibacillus nasuensis]KRK74409.1 myo-inositol-1(or 4)-monophosphatase [Lacticaseibacillus nasuensis JCM 17158]